MADDNSKVKERKKKAPPRKRVPAKKKASVSSSGIKQLGTGTTQKAVKETSSKSQKNEVVLPVGKEDKVSRGTLTDSEKSDNVMSLPLSESNNEEEKTPSDISQNFSLPVKKSNNLGAFSLLTLSYVILLITTVYLGGEYLKMSLLKEEINPVSTEKVIPVKSLSIPTNAVRKIIPSLDPLDNVLRKDSPKISFPELPSPPLVFDTTVKEIIPIATDSFPEIQQTQEKMSSTAESSDLNVDDLAPKEMVIGLPKEPGIEATTPSAVDVLEVNQKNDSAVTSEEANRVSKDKPAVHPITPYPPVYLPSYPGAYPPPAVYPPRNPYFDRGYYPPR